MRRLFVVFIAPLALGCSTSPSSPTDAGFDAASCKLGFLGDPSLPVDMTLVARDGRTSTPIADGARVPLVLPPQGGRVVFIGVSATNVVPCGVKLTGTLRDKTNQAQRVDARVTTLHPTGDGRGASVDADLSSFSNVPTCPNAWASTDVDENAFDLTVTLADPSGRTATKTITVTPFCGEPAYAAECACECKKGYVLGQSCADAGP